MTAAATILDRLQRPLRDLRVSVMDRCNFRCPYCMPVEQYPERHLFTPPAELLQFEEIIRLVRLFAELGVSKLRLTGGEPLLRKDLSVLVGELAQTPGIQDLAMTTNGALLARHAQALKRAGLHRLTVSVDSMNPETFSAMSGGRGSLEQVLGGIDAAVAAGLTDIKINAVVKRHQNDADVMDLVKYFRDHAGTLRFIEYMDVGTLNGWRMDEVVSSAKLRELIHNRWPIEPVEASYRGEVAQRYRYLDGAGEVGFISSITAPFCQDCTRARLSADGGFYTCLFGTESTDLKGPLRDGASDDELRGLIAQVWASRQDRYSEQRVEDGKLKVRVEMYKVGG